MVDVTQQEVADALHTSTTELPDGADADINAAETIVGEQVAPYSDSPDLTHQTAVYVACAFITGTEHDTPISSLRRESSQVSYDTESSSDEAVDFWQRAKMTDPTGRLGEPGVGFEVF